MKTNDHELSRHTLGLAAGRLFVTTKMGLKTKTKLILRKILISELNGLWNIIAGNTSLWPKILISVMHYCNICDTSFNCFLVPCFLFRLSVRFD